MRRAQRNVLHVGMMLVAAFVVCWTYLTVIHAMVVYEMIHYGDVKWNVAIAVILINSCINPFIYSMRYEEFQATAKAMIFKKKQDQRSNVSKTNSTMISN